MGEPTMTESEALAIQNAHEAKLNAQLDTYRASIASVDAAHAKRIADANATLESIASSLRVALAATEETRALRVEQEKKLEATKAEYKEVAATIARVTATHAHDQEVHGARIAALSADIHGNEAILKDLQSKIAAAKQAVNAEDSTLAAKRKQVAEIFVALDESIAEYTATLTRVKGEWAEAHERVAIEEAKVAALKETRQILTEENREAQDKLTAARADAETVYVVIADLKAKSEANNARAAELAKLDDFLTGERVAIKAERVRLDDLKNALNKKEADIKVLVNKIGGAL